jgi:hypothetical protein
VTIASGLPYQQVYDALSDGSRSQRKTKHSIRKSSARDGVNTKRKWFKDYMAGIGFRWVPTMQIGSGTKVHLDAKELPSGRLVVAVSRHYTAVIDGIIHDTHDPRREVSFWHHPDGSKTMVGGRAVYGYWEFVGRPVDVS